MTISSCIFVTFTYSSTYNISHKVWDQSSSPHCQCCLQVSETVSWHKLRSCYSPNMLQHWVGGRGLIYFCKLDHSRIFINFPGIDLVSIIYVRYCRKLKTDLLQIKVFSKYHFKTDTLYLFLFLSSLVFTPLEFDSNYFSNVLFKILKPRDHNEIKPPLGKKFQKYNPVTHYFAIFRR